MTKSSILQTGDFQFFTVTEYGMTFHDATPQTEWLDAVKRLCGMYEGATMTRERSLMLLADALNFGADRYGEEFSQAIDGAREALGLSPKTIANAQWVYKAIESSRRRESLTFAHYALIAALPVEAQDELIGEAILTGMTVRALRAEVCDRFPQTKRGKTRQRKEKETAETALQKLIDASNWLSNNPSGLTAKWKGPIMKLHKAFVREWR